MHAQSLQSCPTLCDQMDCSPPGSSVHGILQARILEWVAMPSSSGSSQPRDEPTFSALQADSLPTEPPGKPAIISLPVSYPFLLDEQVPEEGSRLGAGVWQLVEGRLLAGADLGCISRKPKAGPDRQSQARESEREEASCRGCGRTGRGGWVGPSPPAFIGCSL